MNELESMNQLLIYNNLCKIFYFWTFIFILLTFYLSFSFQFFKISYTVYLFSIFLLLLFIFLYKILVIHLHFDDTRLFKLLASDNNCTFAILKFFVDIYLIFIEILIFDLFSKHFIVCK